MGASKCCMNFLKKKLISKISSVVTLFIATSFTTITALIKVFGIHEIKKIEYYISFIVSIISYIIFGYSLYAVHCGKSTAKYILSIIFVLYGLFVLFFGVTISAKKNKIIYELQKVFTSSSYTDSIKNNFQDSLNCCGTDDCKAKYPKRQDCFQAIETLIKKFTYSGSPLFIVYSILLWIGSIFCYLEHKKGKEVNDVINENLLQTDLKQQYNT